MEFSDILIILPNVKTSKSEGARLYQILASEGIKAHIPGQTSSRDQVFRDGSIAITHIHRAKGNEAPVVFVVNAGFCEGDSALKKRRNILFTAITRSRAWTYISGSGSGMDVIASEVEQIRKDGYALKFMYPAKDQAEALAVTSDGIDGEDFVPAFDDLREALKRGERRTTEATYRLAGGTGGIEWRKLMNPKSACDILNRFFFHGVGEGYFHAAQTHSISDNGSFRKLLPRFL